MPAPDRPAPEPPSTPEGSDPISRSLRADKERFYVEAEKKFAPPTPAQGLPWCPKCENEHPPGPCAVSNRPEGLENYAMKVDFCGECDCPITRCLCGDEDSGVYAERMIRLSDAEKVLEEAEKRVADDLEATYRLQYKGGYEAAMRDKAEAEADLRAAREALERLRWKFTDDYWGDEWTPDYSRCDDCGHYVMVGWTAPTELWREVVGAPDAGTFCPPCFERRAAEKKRIIHWRAEIAPADPATGAKSALRDHGSDDG